MIFVVLGIGDDSTFLFVERTIDAERYLENLSQLGFLEELDRKHGVLQWIFQQDGAPCHTSNNSID
jgi:hypothetical protein